jgi:eukaryotic-like serine/threonine-protein kinase
MGVIAWYRMSTREPRVIGRYLLCDAIASGGMATVHLGRLLGPVGFTKNVAIKRLREDLAAEPGGVTRFLDEARLTAKVQHPNVVSTLDALSVDGEVFLVMEYVKGAPVSLLWRNASAKQEPVPVPVVISIVLGALHGLHAAHAAKGDDGSLLGIVHRDVSPQNIIVGEDGVPRLLDFGVAKATWRLQTTEQGALKGKISYMAPEQLAGLSTDHRIDIFAMGVVLWELLTGARLHKAEDLASTVTAALAHMPRAPSEVIATLPIALDQLVLRALAKDPDERFQTAEAFALALEGAHPAASQRVVGEYVRANAAEYLARQDAQLARFSRHGTLDPDASSGPVSASDRFELPTQRQTPSASRIDPRVPGDSTRTASAIVRSHIPTGLAHGKRLAVLGGLIVIMVVGAAWFALSRHVDAKLEASARALNSTVAPAASPVRSAIASAVTEPSAAPPAMPSAAPAGVPDAGSTRPPRVHRPAAPPPRPTVKPGCNPPYVIDEHGVKRYRPECF